MNEFYKNKKILVTGHTGFKGSWVIKILENFGADVVGYALAPNTTPNLYDLLNPDSKSYLKDIRDYPTLLSAFEKEKPEMVFHLAAQPLVRDSYDDPLYTYSTNVIGTANVLEAIRKTNTVKSAVIVTTDKVYRAGEDKLFSEDDPLGGHDPYSTSKVCAELVTKSYNLSFFEKNSRHVASARAGNVIGGGDWSKDRLLPNIVKSVLEEKEPLVLRYPTAVRPWQHVLDPLFGYLALGQKLYDDHSLASPWNFAPEPENFITVQEITEKSIKVFGKGSYSIQKQDKHETAVLKLDASKAKKLLGWKPLLGISEALDWTLGWYLDYYNGNDAKSLTDKQIDKYLEMLKNA
ncbi:CDP-glucose 4,6-dehydratase [Candidatus Micrarchaeota archaeon]|nr:CDP-glucose 4,6-dehydratase [Candidatus Micrarchaeota archaeon]